MGGFLRHAEQGLIDGHGKGLTSDLSMDASSHSIGFEGRRKEYWDGYAKGYVEGQLLRSEIKRRVDGPLFEEYILLTQYLHSQKWAGCSIHVQDYLDNIDQWSNAEVDLNVCLLSLKYLGGDKIQRAMGEVLEFYKVHFRVKAYREFYSLFQELKHIRTRKAKERDWDTSVDKANLTSALKVWLLRHGKLEM